MDERQLQRILEEIDKQVKLLAGCVHALAAIETARQDVNAEQIDARAANIVQNIPSEYRKGAREMLAVIKQMRAQLTPQAPENP